MPLFHINDIFVSGFAAERCNFSRNKDERFTAGKLIVPIAVIIMQLREAPMEFYPLNDD